MPRLISLSLALITLSLTSWATSIETSFDLAGLGPTQRQDALQLAREIDLLLPEKLKSVVARGLTIQFRPLNGGPLTAPNCQAVSGAEGASKASHLLGRFYPSGHRSSGTIVIERQLLAQYANGETTTYPCRHGHLRNRALATILHEIFHAYDYWAGPERPSSCRRGPRKRGGTLGPCPPDRRPRQLSQNEIFLSRSFWRKKRNNIRVPDPYEAHNAEEYAAVNFEYFILDPQYRCRRPAQYRHFSQEFDHFPHSEWQCSPLFRVLISGKKGKELVDIDPKRVYQIHYLLADKGDGLIAGFGHSSIRLVICAPEHRDIHDRLIPATPMGPQCLRDIDHHLVVSFRANVDDFILNKRQGLFGGYPSILFMLTLKGVMNEYNKKNMRTLYSFPLKYNEQQKRDFIANMTNIHWEYRGNYKFTATNCASESLELITSVYDDKSYYIPRAIKPFGVLKKLTQMGIVDAKYNARDSFQQLEPFNIFKGNEHFLSIAYGILFPETESLRGGSKRRKTIVRYVTQSAQKRAALLKQLQQEQGANRDLLRKQVGSFLLLERQALLTYDYHSQKDILKRLIIKTKRNQYHFDLERMSNFMASTVPTGQSYGIPQEDEWETIGQNLILEEEELLKFFQEHRATFNQLQQKYSAERESIQHNIQSAEQYLQSLK